MNTRKPMKWASIMMLASFVLAACGGSEETPTPTLDPNAIRTQAVATFSADLTATALAQPTATGTSTPTFIPTATLGTPSVFNPAGGGIPTATQGCYRAAFVTDVTIPDNTPVTPGQTFTKTWRMKNTGTCNWDAGFKFAFTGGEAMGGSTYTLPNPVAPNAETDISVNMTAPTNKTGTLRGNWRMSTASGQFFGDEVYVVVVVGSASTAEATASSSTPPAPTATTPTP